MPQMFLPTTLIEMWSRHPGVEHSTPCLAAEYYSCCADAVDACYISEYCIKIKETAYCHTIL